MHDAHNDEGCTMTKKLMMFWYALILLTMHGSTGADAQANFWQQTNWPVDGGDVRALAISLMSFKFRVSSRPGSTAVICRVVCISTS